MNAKPRIIALTGGIASGKSEAAQFFQSKGIQVIDADKIARDLFTKDSVHLQKLKQSFGSSIFYPDGQLNRQALAEIVFKDPQQLEQLNQLTHPLVRQEIIRQINQLDGIYGLVDIPLLVDIKGILSSDYVELIDRILVIEAKPDIQLERLMKRNKLTREQALQRIKAQATNQQRRSVAHDLVVNNQDLIHLKKELEKLHQRYLNLSN